jgi:hypothetical protein
MVPVQITMYQILPRVSCIKDSPFLSQPLIVDLQATGIRLWYLVGPVLLLPLTFISNVTVSACDLVWSSKQLPFRSLFFLECLYFCAVAEQQPIYLALTIPLVLWRFLIEVWPCTSNSLALSSSDSRSKGTRALPTL